MYIYLTNRFSQLDWCFYFILFFTLYFSTDRFHGTLLSMQFFCYVWFDFACLKQFGFSQWDVAKSCHMLFTVTQLQASRFCRNLMLQKIVKQQTIGKFQIETLSETRATLFWMKQMNTIEQSLYIKIDLFAKKIHSLFENSLQNQLQFVSLHENSFGVAQKEANFKYERDNYIVFRVKFQHLHFVDDFSVIQKIWRNSSDNGRWWGCNFSFFNFHAKMENAIKLDEQNQKLVFSLSVDRHTHRTITRNHMNWIARVANDLNERTKMDLHWFENDQYSRNID